MATTIQDELYNTFMQVQGQQASAISDVGITLADVLAQVQDLRAATPAPNVKSPTSSSSSSTSGSSAQTGGVEDTLSSVASTVLKSGFGLAPLVSGLFSLFDGGDSSTPAPLVKYAMPASANFEAAESRSGVSGLDYDQSGAARVYRAGSTTGTTSMSTGEGASVAAAPIADSRAAATAEARQAPQITVNVQAMDARSFLDRSSDIALAVRDAMLNMNAINDVVNEL
jgi:hypothetical protein